MGPVSPQLPCPFCKYDLVGLRAGHCPECGGQFQWVERPVRPRSLPVWRSLFTTGALALSVVTTLLLLPLPAPEHRWTPDTAFQVSVTTPMVFAALALISIGKPKRGWSAAAVTIATYPLFVVASLAASPHARELAGLFIVSTLYALALVVYTWRFNVRKAWYGFAASVLIPAWLIAMVMLTTSVAQCLAGDHWSEWHGPWTANQSPDPPLTTGQALAIASACVAALAPATWVLVRGWRSCTSGL